MTDIVIVGAPRSGTNMLRDVLASLPTLTTWPCDEINLVWKHGNRQEPSDELTPEDARPEVRDYVRGRFDRLRRRHHAEAVVEKTCATSLPARWPVFWTVNVTSYPLPRGRTPRFE